MKLFIEKKMISIKFKKKLYPIPKEFCCWDKLEIIGPKKISEF